MKLHGLGGVDLAHFAGPADIAAAVVMRHIGGGHELLEESALGVGISAHPPLLDHHVAFLVELARRHVGQPSAFQPRPQLQAVFRHRPEEHRLVQPRGGIQAFGSVALGHIGELVGNDVLVRFSFGFLECLLQLGQLLLVAAHCLQVLSLVGIVGRFHLGQRDLLGGVVGGANLAGSLEGQVLEHMGQAALARGVVHISRVDKGGVAEDRCIRPLANEQRQSIRQNLGRDSLLETLQILRLRACERHRSQRQDKDNLPGPGKNSAMHPASLF